MIAGFRDDGAAVGMSHENNVAAYTVNGGFCNRHIVGQRPRWVLNDDDLIALVLQNFVDTRPSRSIDKTAMNENDGLPVAWLLSIHDAHLS
jgi:hypothetical protein